LFSLYAGRAQPTSEIGIGKNAKVSFTQNIPPLYLEKFSAGKSNKKLASTTDFYALFNVLLLMLCDFVNNGHSRQCSDDCYLFRRNQIIIDTAFYLFFNGLGKSKHNRNPLIPVDTSLLI
jgi:hypothetical protein